MAGPVRAAGAGHDRPPLERSGAPRRQGADWRRGRFSDPADAPAVAVILSAMGVLLVLMGLSPMGPAAAHEDDEDASPPVFLIHGMPDTVFEVQVGEDRRLKGLRFGQFYNLRAFAGTTLSFGFKILDTGEPVVATDGFAVPSDRSSSLVVHLGPNGSGSLTAFDNKLDPLNEGMSRLTVRHLAEAPPLDVIVDGEALLAGVEHGWEESIELPAGEVSVSLVAADGSEVDTGDVGPVTVPLTPGDRIVVYGFGSVAEGTLAIVTDVVHGPEADPDDGLPLRALAVSSGVACCRRRRRAVPHPAAAECRPLALSCGHGNASSARLRRDGTRGPSRHRRHQGHPWRRRRQQLLEGTAHQPGNLRRIWEGLKEVMGPGALDPLTKELVYLAVSVANNCDYCAHSHTASARARA